VKNDVKELIATEIADTYKDILLNGFEEQEYKFFVTLLVIEFIAKLREKNIVYDLSDIFAEKIISLMYEETNKFIGI